MGESVAWVPLKTKVGVVKQVVPVGEKPDKERFLVCTWALAVDRAGITLVTW